MNILGISAFFHDSAAVLLKDGQLIAAAQEERFSRVKNDAQLPVRAIRHCLQAGGIGFADIDVVGYYDNPYLSFERLLVNHIDCAPAGLTGFSASLPTWLKHKVWVKNLLRELVGERAEIFCGTHHESHAASAFFPSPFERATVVTIDGVGEWATSSWGHGVDNRITMEREIRFPDSIGLLYGAFTQHLGFKVDSDEYKVMGLAPYGSPVFVQKILDEMLDLRDDGSFRLNMKYFGYRTGLGMTSSSFESLFGVPRRRPEAPLTPEHMNLAASVQAVTEEVVRRIVEHAIARTGCRDLCMAGGVALNCVANGKLLANGICDRIWVQPAAGDAGGALGVAYYLWHQHFGRPRVLSGVRDSQRGSLLGPAYTDDEIGDFLAQNGYAFTTPSSEEELFERVCALLEGESVVGWFQGGMEFGPRALGSRSIIADARSQQMQSVLNLKIKNRESFRPFAPAILAEKVSDYFELEGSSDYMLLVTPVRKDRLRPVSAEEDALFGIEKLKVARSSVPAITHVDCSARVQTVQRDTNPRFYGLLECFERRTGCPLLVNTSFNVRDEPIVESPADAYRCFMSTGMDALVLGRHLLLKEHQPQVAAKIHSVERTSNGASRPFTIYVVGDAIAAGEPYGRFFDLGKLVALSFGETIEGRPVRVVNLARRGASAADALGQAGSIVDDASLVLVHVGCHELQDKGFRATLDAIVSRLVARGVPVLGVVPAANCADYEPNVSTYESTRERLTVEQLLSAAERLATDGAKAAAYDALEAVALAHPRVSAAQWAFARAARELGRYDVARRAYGLARDHDGSGRRPTAAIRDAARDTFVSRGIPFVDAEKVLEGASDHGLVGSSLLWDCCLPNLEGYAAIASAISERLATQLRLSLESFHSLTEGEIGHRFLLDRARKSEAAVDAIRGLLADALVFGNETCLAAAQDALRRLPAALMNDVRILTFEAIVALLEEDPARARQRLEAALAVDRPLATRYRTSLAEFVASAAIPATVLEAAGIPRAGRLDSLRRRARRSSASKVASALHRAAVSFAYYGVVLPGGWSSRRRSAHARNGTSVSASSYWAPYSSPGVMRCRPAARRLDDQLDLLRFLANRQEPSVTAVTFLLMLCSAFMQASPVDSRQASLMAPAGSP